MLMFRELRIGHCCSHLLAPMVLVEGEWGFYAPFYPSRRPWCSRHNQGPTVPRNPHSLEGGGDLCAAGGLLGQHRRGLEHPSRGCPRGGACADDGSTDYYWTTPVVSPAPARQLFVPGLTLEPVCPLPIYDARQVHAWWTSVPIPAHQPFVPEPIHSLPFYAARQVHGWWISVPIPAHQPFVPDLTLEPIHSPVFYAARQVHGWWISVPIPAHQPFVPDLILEPIHSPPFYDARQSSLQSLTVHRTDHHSVCYYQHLTRWAHVTEWTYKATVNYQNWLYWLPRCHRSDTQAIVHVRPALQVDSNPIIYMSVHI